jgi:hypothetical protein
MGGLVLNVDTLGQGTMMPGSARKLQNFEPAIAGGYRRINGYEKFDTDVVPGDTDEPVLGVKVGLGGVFAVRKTGTDNAIYFSTGGGWSGPLNGTARTGSVTKARGLSYSIVEPTVLFTDGFNYAWKYNGTTETVINGVGAPADPKYAAIFRDRLVLSGYSSNVSAISISGPGSDTDFTGGGGAIEINVGDEVTGIYTFRDTLYIFCKNSLHSLSGTSATNFAIQDVAASIGCVSQDTIREIGGDVIYLSYDGFRSLAATIRVGDIELGLVSGNIQPLVTQVLDAALGEDAFATITIAKKSQYRLFINDPSVNEEDATGFLAKYDGRAPSESPSASDLKFSWATLLGIKPYSADSAFTNNQEYSVFGHPTSGYVYRLESGSTFDGVNIQAVYRTPDIVFASDKIDSTIRKVFQKATFYMQVEGDINMNVALRLDREQDDILQPDAVAFEQIGTLPVYGTAVYGTSSYGALETVVFKTNLIGSGFTGAFELSISDDSAPVRIDSFVVQLAAKGKR